MRSIWLEADLQKCICYQNFLLDISKMEIRNRKFFWTPNLNEIKLSIQHKLLARVGFWNRHELTFSHIFPENLFLWVFKIFNIHVCSNMVTSHIFDSLFHMIIFHICLFIYNIFDSGHSIEILIFVVRPS